MDLRNRLLQVSELNLADKIDSMDETQLGLYIQKINYFIDSYPNQERSVKEAVAARDMGLISKSLVSVWDMLDKLHAENLSERGLALITSAKGSSAEKMEAEVTAFLTDAAALSIEMQMAQQLIEDGTIDPSLIVSHIGGLSDVCEILGNSSGFAGGKKLIYPQIPLPLTAVSEWSLEKERELLK